MILLSASPLVEKKKAALQHGTAAFRKTKGRAPKLVVVLVGEDPASKIYTSKKTETARTLGFEGENFSFPESVSPEIVRRKIDTLNLDPTVDGILVQRPLPSQFQEKEVLEWIVPHKDVDGFHPENVGRLAAGLPCLRACTPSGILSLLDHYQIKLSGKLACVLGRSATVGKPMAQLLLQRDSTVIQCHSKTTDLEKLTKMADVLVVAIGKPKFLHGDAVKSGATVIDVGIHRSGNSASLCGDVDFESVSKIAGALTPVPGGVGPLTIYTLLENTLQAATAFERKLP